MNTIGRKQAIREKSIQQKSNKMPEVTKIGIFLQQIRGARLEDKYDKNYVINILTEHAELNAKNG